MRGNGSSKIVGLLVFLSVLVAASGCVETPDSGNESASVNESATYWPTDGWRTSTPEQQGMDSEMHVAGPRALGISTAPRAASEHKDHPISARRRLKIGTREDWSTTLR